MPVIRDAAAMLALVVLASPANAQDAPTAEAAMARVIHGALAPSSLGDWRYRWDAVSIRISRDMHWHLAGPDDADAETITRNGWILGGGLQIGVSAHGSGDTVAGLTLDYYRWPQFDGEPLPVIAALAELGVEATEIARKDAPDFYHADAPIVVYRLSAPGRDSAELTQSVQCTSPRAPPRSGAACPTHSSLAADGPRGAQCQTRLRPATPPTPPQAKARQGPCAARERRP